MALKSVKVPAGFEPVFAKAEAVVSNYFSQRLDDPSTATIEVCGERYVLVRAAALSVEFFSLVRELFGPGRQEQADDFARNILFDLAHAIGKSDAQSFHAKMHLKDPIERLSAGPVHFSHTGWAFVDISPESHPSCDADFCLMYDHPYSFEADAWIRNRWKPDFPACIMNAGYSSGWCEASFGFPLTAGEILCRARGDPCCRFIMAPPGRIEAHVNRYVESMPHRSREKESYVIPDFFARKRAEEALREAHHELERKVEERTAELVEANRRLQDEIARRKREEERLRLLSRAVEQSSESVCVADLEGVVRFANEAFARMHGYAPNEVAGRTISAYHAPAHMPAVEAALQHVRDAGTFAGEIWHARRDGSVFPTSMCVSLLRDEDGNAIGVIGTARDITERKRAEEALRASEERYRGLVELSPEAIFVNRDNRIVFLNPAALRLFGAATAAQILGKSPFDVFHADYHAIMRERIGRLLGGQPVSLIEERIVRLDGTIRDVEVAASPFVDQEGPAIQVILRDITERKRADEELKKHREHLAELVEERTAELRTANEELAQAEARYRDLFENAPDLMALLDVPTGKVLRCNETLAAALGLRKEDIVGRSFLSFYSPESRAAAEESFASFADTGSVSNVERSLRRSDGSTIEVLVQATPIRDASGRIVAGRCTWRDITKLKHAERELAKHIAALARSNAELQEFAYVASHDLQEPLRKILAFGDRLKATCGEGLTDQGRDYMERMLNASRRMQTLINDLLTFSRVTTHAQPCGLLDLNEVLRDVLSDLELRIEQTGAHVDAGELPTVQADPTQMRQLFQNLIGNALKFRRPDASPHVRIRAESTGAMHQIAVEDNGIGFDEKYADRIFGIFQRLHGRGEYEGTGIGLAVCQKIVKRHGGEITAKSAPGHGSTFIVSLPIEHQGASHEK